MTGEQLVILMQIKMNLYLTHYVNDSKWLLEQNEKHNAIILLEGHLEKVDMTLGLVLNF